MSLTEIYTLDGVTVTTVISVPSGNSTPSAITTDGVYHGWFDGVQGGALTKGDYFKAQVLEKCLSGSTQRAVFCMDMGNVATEAWITPSLMLMHGWDFLLTKVAGTARAWDASIRGVTCTITQEYAMSAVSISTNEISIVSGTTSLQTVTTDGIYQLFVDPVAAAMAKADEFIIRVYEKVEGSSGTKRVIFSARLMDVQDELFVTPTFQLMNGWDMTIQRISGADRNFDASIRKVA